VEQKECLTCDANTSQARKAILMNVSIDSTSRNDCIMVAMKRSEAMIRSYAQTHDLDFEDLYQDMAEFMLHVWERMPADMESPTPYLGSQHFFPPKSPLRV